MCSLSQQNQKLSKDNTDLKRHLELTLKKLEADDSEISACQREIEAHLKSLDQMKAANNDAPPRYKFIFQATMGENHQQMIRCASRCLWDSEVDNCASAFWTNGRVYAVAMCFALYYE